MSLSLDITQALQLASASINGRDRGWCCRVCTPVIWLKIIINHLHHSQVVPGTP